jgi:hypothetical protein
MVPTENGDGTARIRPNTWELLQLVDTTRNSAPVVFHDQTSGLAKPIGALRESKLKQDARQRALMHARQSADRWSTCYELLEYRRHVLGSRSLEKDLGDKVLVGVKRSAPRKVATTAGSKPSEQGSTLAQCEPVPGSRCVRPSWRRRGCYSPWIRQRCFADSSRHQEPITHVVVGVTLLSTMRGPYRSPLAQVAMCLQEATGE